MFSFVFKTNKNVLFEQNYQINDYASRKDFIKKIYASLTDKIDTAHDNFIGEKLSNSAQEVFKNMIGLIESQRDFIKTNGRDFINQGFVIHNGKFDLLIHHSK